VPTAYYLLPSGATEHATAPLVAVAMAIICNVPCAAGLEDDTLYVKEVVTSWLLLEIQPNRQEDPETAVTSTVGGGSVTSLKVAMAVAEMLVAGQSLLPVTEAVSIIMLELSEV
jgi:hypothetical protein